MINCFISSSVATARATAVAQAEAAQAEAAQASAIAAAAISAADAPSDSA